jgi:YegS/Rv2252/BmrU family lipid kinase
MACAGQITRLFTNLYIKIFPSLTTERDAIILIYKKYYASPSTCPGPVRGFFILPLRKPPNIYIINRTERKMTKSGFLIVNPVSGGYSENRLKAVKTLFEAGGLSVETMLTTCPGDAKTFAGDICRNVAEPFIIAAGGDGTVNGVVNGLLPGKSILAVLPLGTANVLARELAINSAEEAVSRIIRGETRPLTVGVLQGEAAERRFLLMAGIGLDGTIVENVRLREKRLIGKGAYILSAARQMARWKGSSFEVIAGDRIINCHSLIVCNAARYGGDFVVAPAADIFSPGLQAVCMTGNSRASYLRFLMDVMRGRVMDNPDITILSGDDFIVMGNRAMQVDGDYLGKAPVRIRALEGFARLIV